MSRHGRGHKLRCSGDVLSKVGKFRWHIFAGQSSCIRCHNGKNALAINEDKRGEREEGRKGESTRFPNAE